MNLPHCRSLQMWYTIEVDDQRGKVQGRYINEDCPLKSHLALVYPCSYRSELKLSSNCIFQLSLIWFLILVAFTIVLYHIPSIMKSCLLCFLCSLESWWLIGRFIPTRIIVFPSDRYWYQSAEYWHNTTTYFWFANLWRVQQIFGRLSGVE